MTKKELVRLLDAYVKNDSRISDETEVRIMAFFPPTSEKGCTFEGSIYYHEQDIRGVSLGESDKIYVYLDCR